MFYVINRCLILNRFYCILSVLSLKEFKRERRSDSHRFPHKYLFFTIHTLPFYYGLHNNLACLIIRLLSFPLQTHVVSRKHGPKTARKSEGGVTRAAHASWWRPLPQRRVGEARSRCHVTHARLGFAPNFLAGVTWGKIRFLDINSALSTFYIIFALRFTLYTTSPKKISYYWRCEQFLKSDFWLRIDTFLW